MTQPNIARRGSDLWKLECLAANQELVSRNSCYIVRERELQTFHLYQWSAAEGRSSDRVWILVGIELLCRFVSDRLLPLFLCGLARSPISNHHDDKRQQSATKHEHHSTKEPNKENK